MLKVELLCLAFGRNRGQVAEVVVFAAVGDGFEVFSIPAMGDADTGDVTLFCHIYSPLFFNKRIVGKLISGDSAAFFYQADDPLGIGICLRELIQCIFDETMIFHFGITPFESSIYTLKRWYAINKDKVFS